MNKLKLTFRWIGRGLSLVSILFLVLSIFADGFPPITRLTLCFPFGVLLGLILSWFFEGLGGAFTLLCMTLFYILEHAADGTWPRGPFFIFLIVPGVFFLLSAVLEFYLKRSAQKQKAHGNKLR